MNENSNETNKETRIKAEISRLMTIKETPKMS
jgi:hypothetical protein